MIMIDDIVRDMLIGTCWSNVKMDTTDYLQNPVHLTSRSSDWHEIGTTRAILALPGLNKNDIAVEIEGQVLKVLVMNWQGVKKYAGRTFKLILGDHVNKEAVSAIMENGLLTINYPSVPEYQRTIEIK